VGLAYLYDQPRMRWKKKLNWKLYLQHLPIIARHENIFAASLGLWLHTHHITPDKVLVDQHHPNVSMHHELSKLLFLSFTCSLQGKFLHLGQNALPNGNNYSNTCDDCPIYQTLLRSIPKQSLLLDQPSLSDTSAFHLDPVNGSKSAPGRLDRQQSQLIASSCRLIRFGDVRPGMSILGIGIWGAFKITVSGADSSRSASVDRFIKSYHDQWPIWLYINATSTSFNLSLCPNMGQARLRWFALHAISTLRRRVSQYR